MQEGSADDLVGTNRSPVVLTSDTPHSSRPIYDLSMPIEDHFRWKVDREQVQSFEAGDQFQVTRLAWAVHGFTHIDSPRHIVPNGYTSSEFDLNRLVGEACIVDLTGIEENQAISSDVLAEAAGHLREGDIVILKTCWDERQSIQDDDFWRKAPYLTREACIWLLEKNIQTLGVDFPQDQVIRNLLDGEIRPLEEFVSHDVLLKNGIPLIEYLCKLGSVPHKRVQLFSLPLKIPESDGCPARVIAMPIED